MDLCAANITNGTLSPCRNHWKCGQKSTVLFDRRPESPPASKHCSPSGMCTCGPNGLQDIHSHGDIRPEVNSVINCVTVVKNACPTYFRKSGCGGG